MAGYSARHKAPAKHRARGRALFLTRPSGTKSGGKRVAGRSPVPAASSPPTARAAERPTPALTAGASEPSAGVPPLNVPPVAGGDLGVQLAPPARKSARLNPTVAAVTAASIGVTGAVGGGILVSGAYADSKNTLVLSDLSVPGAFPTKKARPKQSATPSATPRFTTHTVTPTPTPTVTSDPTPATGTVVHDRTAAERRRAQERAARYMERFPAGSAKQIAAELVRQRGWDSVQFTCLDAIWTRESGWRVDATNPRSGAYGIPQALPGSKMASHGSDWRTNPRTQIRWGLDYIASRYSTPCGAWEFWKRNGWY
ncbi:hypothetical protein DFJ64_1001 [Thermasporomyces composti]|uniref:Transglycosylase-like protein with SLT domain n=1 Tax=Thermasporomyces composti TaxID=696763 RepID=A0A3D9V1F7_THECX|nr:hypothetical protein DFJ64_1001 [Thermasporomyces composti]